MNARLASIGVAIASVVSAYVGAHIATVRALRGPDRIAVQIASIRQSRYDSILSVNEKSHRSHMDGLCSFDFRHAVGNKELQTVFEGYGPTMRDERGHCALVGTDSVRWVP